MALVVKGDNSVPNGGEQQDLIAYQRDENRTTPNDIERQLVPVHADDDDEASQEKTQLVPYNPTTAANNVNEDDSDSDSESDSESESESESERSEQKPSQKMAHRRKKKPLEKTIDKFLPPKDPEKDKGPMVKDPYTQYQIHLSMLFLTMISFIFAMIVVQNCDMMKIGNEGDGYDEMDSRGLFTQPQTNMDGVKLGCVRYDPTLEISRNQVYGRLFGVVLVLSVGICLIVLVPWFLTMRSTSYKRCFTVILRIFYPMALIFTIFMIGSMFNIPECDEEGKTCKAGLGSYVTLFNLVILFALTAMIFITGPPKHPVFITNPRLPKKPEKNKKGDKGRSPEQPRSSKKDKKKKKGKNDVQEEQSESRNIDESTSHFEDDIGPDDIVEKTMEPAPGGGMKTTFYITHPDGTQTVKEKISSKEVV